MTRKLKLIAAAFVLIVLAIPALVYANSTSVETGGTQFLPMLSLTGGASSAGTTLGLKDGRQIVWSPTGNSSSGGATLRCNSVTAICTFNVSYLEVAGGGNTFYYDGVIAQSGSARSNLIQGQANLDTTIKTNTGASGQAILMGTSVADGTAGIAGTTLLNLGTGVTNGTGGSGTNGSVANSKFMVNGAGTSTFTAANGVNAIALATNGSRLDLGTGGSDYLYSDGTTVSSPGNLSANAFIGQNNNSVVLQAQNVNAGITVTGALLFGVGTAGSTANQSAIGTYSKNVTIVGSGADTTEDNLMTSALPASALNVDTRAVRVTAWGDGVSTADVTTVKCYFGATAVVSKVLTASQANTWRTVFEVMRTGATTQTASGTFYNGGTANTTVQSNAAPAETLANAITVKCTGQRTVSSVANSVRQLALIVEVLN